MINIQLKTNKSWTKFVEKNLKIWIKGYIYSHSIEDILKIFKDIKKDEVSSFIESIDGHFALVCQRNDLTFIVVDKIRSTPLFFTKIKNDFFIDNNPSNLVRLNGFTKIIDENARLELAMSGFTIGNKTIYKNLYCLKAGELVFLNNNHYEYSHYYKYFSELVVKNYEDYLDELSKLTLNIFKKMLSKIGDRQIIIPLSAGHDSRLIASILKHLGVKNVKCYSYGTPGNFEAKMAKRIAQKLDYDWKFIPLTYLNEKKYYVSNEYREYLKFSETYSSVPFIQSLSSVKYLKDLKWINQDSIFINGLSGDFISGGHANINDKYQNKDLSLESRKENILNKLIEKHFSLWGSLKTKDNIDKIKNNLWNEITKACGKLKNKDQDHLFFEYSEVIDRQSKYVITKQNIYEFYGYESRLPLWDDQYLNFWKQVPLNFKLKQKLYKDMLIKNNFGGVWSENFFLNRKTITPKWVIPLRFVVKIPFGLFGKLGKKAWKQFEINFFKYLTSTAHTWDMYNYFRIVKDIFKKPRNSVSWQVEDYLKKFKDESY